MKDLADVQCSTASWKKDNPTHAAIDFCKRYPSFVIEQPKLPFNESKLDRNLTHWPDAWIKRVAK